MSGDEELYPGLLGDSFARLAPAVRALLSGPSARRARGTLCVTRGGGIARLFGALMGAPPAGEDVPFELVISRAAAGETWDRGFAGCSFVAVQRPIGEMLGERVGPFEVVFALAAEESGALDFKPVRFGLAVGPLRLTLPLWAAPRIEGRTWGEGESVRVMVRVSSSFAGLILAYDGRVVPEAA
jgi:hypothetical protein